jgi:hypothetical protein
MFPASLALGSGAPTRGQDGMRAALGTAPGGPTRGDGETTELKFDDGARSVRAV